ncbi:hypothetical protein ACT7DF_30755 [Bacillus cereus]
MDQLRTTGKQLQTWALHGSLVTHTFKWISTSDDRLRFEPINAAAEIGVTRFVQLINWKKEILFLVINHHQKMRSHQVVVTLFEIQVLIVVLWIGTTIIQPLKQKITVPQNPDLGSVLKNRKCGRCY